MKLSKEKIATALKMLVALVSALFIFLFSLSALATVLTSKQYILHTVGSSAYLENAQIMLKDGLASLAIPSGLPENFFDDKINQDKLHSINYEYINSCYTKGNAEIDTTDLKAELIKTFKDYAASGALASSVDINDESLSYLADKCVEQYMTVSGNNIFRYISIYASKANGYMVYAVLFTLAFSLFGIIFLAKVSRGSDKKYLYFALCGGGAMTALLPLILLIIRFANRLGISSKAMHTFVSSYLNNALICLVIFGVILIAVSVFILLKKKSAPILEEN